MRVGSSARVAPPPTPGTCSVVSTVWRSSPLSEEELKLTMCVFVNAWYGAARRGVIGRYNLEVQNKQNAFAIPLRRHHTALQHAREASAMPLRTRLQLLSD